MNKIISSSIVLIAGALMMASTVNGQGITIEKRHYKSGYYIDFGKKKTEVKQTSTVKQNIATVQVNNNNAIPTAPVKNEQMQMVAVTNQSAIKVDAEATKRECNKNRITKKINEIYNNKVAANTSTTVANDVVASPDVANNSKTVEGSGGSVPLIVLVILAIFIPPLGVYLHDGQIVTHFWWILILFLIGTSWIFGLLGEIGICWLIAAIWALVIVLGSASGV